MAGSSPGGSGCPSNKLESWQQGGVVVAVVVIHAAANGRSFGKSGDQARRKTANSDRQ